MRIHSAAAFLLAKGFGSNNNNHNDFALDMRDLGFVPTVPAVPQGWGRNLGLLQMAQDDADFANSVAGAFNNLNSDMKKQNEETLDALKELSDSFKKLAESDLTKLFPNARKVVPAEAPPARTYAIAAAETSLDNSTPLSGSTFSHPSHTETFFSETVPEQAPAAPSITGSSYMQSLKKTANFSASSQKAASPSASAAINGAGSSYLDALQGTKAKSSTTDLPKRKVSYSSYSPPAQQQQQPAATAGSSYLDAIGGQSPAAGAAQSYAPSAGSYRYSNAPPQYLDSVAQQEMSEMQYATPPEQVPPPSDPYMGAPPQNPYMEEPVPTQNPYMEEPTVGYADPSIPKDAAILEFSPDNEDVMKPGSAPKIETPRVRYVKQDPGFHPDMEWSQAPRIGAQKVSGYIPSSQPGMNGVNYHPDPKPKAPRPVFSKKYSGIHSDFDEMIQPASAQAVPPPPNTFVPRPTPKTNVQTRHSIAAQRVKDVPDWQNDFEHPPQDIAKPQPPVSVFAKRVGGSFGQETPSNHAKPEPPRSVFAQKVSGVADMNGAPSYPKPEPPRSVFSQKVSGIADFNGPPPNVPKPEPPRSIFSQKVKGIADFNGPPPHVPKPEPPRSVFAQKIASNVPRNGISSSPHGDFEANGNVPKPNPRAARQQQQAQPYGRAVRAVTPNPGFQPDNPEAMEAGGIRTVPIPDYYQAQNHYNHQDWSNDMGNSFQVIPDDRIGGLQDEYLR